MDEIGRGTSTFDGLALAIAIARHLIEQNQSYTLFATHYFELTRLEDEYPDVANVHVSAVEHKDRIVFLHTVEQGPASRSYGIQVAQLAGVPQPVIKTARKQLAKLERDAVANSPQRDLFSEATSVTPDSHPVIDVLEALDPDSMSPKQALEAVYELKSRLRDQPDDGSDHSD